MKLSVSSEPLKIFSSKKKQQKNTIKLIRKIILLNDSFTFVNKIRLFFGEYYTRMYNVSSISTKMLASCHLLLLYHTFQVFAMKNLK